MRTRQEIEDQLGKVDADAAAGGQSRWPGMNYEQGVETALLWALGDSSDEPMAG
jgi:hypothetical protein